MFKMMYSCVFLVARKPTTDHGAQQAGGDDPLPELQTVEPAADSTMSCTIALETQSTDLTIQSVTGTTTQS